MGMSVCQKAKTLPNVSTVGTVVHGKIPKMAQLSTFSFVLYTIGLLMVWLVVISMAEIESVVPSKPQEKSTGSWRYTNPVVERKNERNCKALCEHCGCLGFYCGEECICECNNENSDIECISTMQSNARKLDIPFEILIQGPSRNRFVRNAFQFEQNPELRKCAIAANAAGESPRIKRSTVTIYKPTVQKQSSGSSALNALGSTHDVKLEKSMERHKRAVENFAWFNDIANNLVRPAPLITRNKKVQEAAPAVTTNQRKRQANAAEHPWYMLDAIQLQHLTRPAPLQKRKDELKKTKSKNPQKIKSETEQKSPFDHAMDAVERLPQVLQESLSSGALEKNIENMSNNFINTADLFQSSLTPPPPPSNDFPKIKRSKLTKQKLVAASTIKDDLSRKRPLAIAPPPSQLEQKTASTQPKGLFPWLKNRRLMLRRRLQQQKEQMEREKQQQRNERSSKKVFK